MVSILRDATNCQLRYYSYSNSSRPSLQLCSSLDKQKTSLSGNASTATPVDPVCSSRDTRISKLQTLSFVDCTPLPTLSFVWQIKPTIPSLLLYNQSLQLHPSFSSLLPTATPCTTFGNSDLPALPQGYLLTQPRIVDCPYIYPYSN